MKRLLLLIAAVTLVLSADAVAGEINVLESVRADTVCPVKVVTLKPAQGLSGIIELVPQVIEVRSFALDLRTDAVEASVTAETDCGPSGGVLATVVRALGKALLKALANLIHHIV
jgi:hypothetical protein